MLPFNANQSIFTFFSTNSTNNIKIQQSPKGMKKGLHLLDRLIKEYYSLIAEDVSPKEV
jgi:hypothetical protein